MSEFVIAREVTGQKGRHVIRQGGATAELNYSVTTPTLVIDHHTNVPDTFRGTGAGLAMVTRLVEDARAEGFKVTPLCPFVNVQHNRHPEWADMFAV